MSYLSNFLGLPNLIAGYALAVKDLVLFGPLGKAYPAVRTDYAVAANVGASIVAQTSVIAGVANGRCAEYVDTDGSVYIAAPNNISDGLKIYKYSPLGVLLKSLQIDATASNLGPFKIAKLTNGNFVVTYFDGTNVAFVIVTSALLSITVGPTTIGTLSGGANKSETYDMIVLTGGGFAVVFTPTTPTADTYLAVYSDAGAVVFSPQNVGTIASAGTGTFYAMCQLSSGDIAIARHHTNGGTLGLYYMIRSATGTLVKAITYEVITAGAYVPLIKAMTGSFCIAVHNGTNALAYVYDNTGTRVGTGMSSVCGVVWPAATNCSKLLSDGTQYWLLCAPPASNVFLGVIKIPTTGANNYTVVQTDLTYASARSIDAMIDAYSGLLVYARASESTGATTNQVATFDLSTQTTVTPLTNFGTASTGTSTGVGLAILPAGGDMAFSAVYSYTNTLGTYFTISKFADTAIVGVANSGTAAGGTVPIAETVGTYGISTLVGTGVKAFDHTTGTNIQGNKGTVQRNGVTLRGM